MLNGLEKERRELAQAVQTAIEAFEKKTGLQVEEIRLVHAHEHGRGGFTIGVEPKVNVLYEQFLALYDKVHAPQNPVVGQGQTDDPLRR
jgi:hypothetical protein